MWSFDDNQDDLKVQLEHDLEETQRIGVLLALAHIYHRDDSFVPYYEDAERLLIGQAQPDMRQKANLRFLRGVRLERHEHDDNETSIDVLNEALTLYVGIGDKRGELECLKRLGPLYGYQNRLDEAKSAVERCRLLLEENNFPPIAEAEVFYRVGTLFVHMELPHLAENYGLKTLERGEALQKEVRHLGEGRLWQTAALLHIGGLWVLCQVRIQQKRYSEALEYAQKKLELCQEFGVDAWTSSALVLLCTCLVLLGTPEDAILHLEPILDDLSPEDEGIYGHCYVPLGNAYLDTEQYEKARHAFERGIDLQKRRDFPEEGRLDALKGLSNVYKHMGEHEKALHYMEMYADESKALSEDEHNKALRTLSARHEYDLKKREADILLESNVQLTEANRLLQQAYDEQSELLGIVAHDLRNPLQVITLRARMAEKFVDQNVREKVLKSVRAVRDSADFMNDVIGQLQTMSDVDEDRMEIDWEPIQVTELLDVVMERNRIVAEKKGITIVQNVREPFEVMADRIILQQVCENLLSNSIKYSPSGTTVVVMVRNEGGMGTISWTDEGVGIASAELSKLFTKFGRLPSSRPTEGEHSTGLGLYITKKQVEVMGGEITAASDGLNEGATFTVTLPIYVQNETVLTRPKLSDVSDQRLMMAADVIAPNNGKTRRSNRVFGA